MNKVVKMTLTHNGILEEPMVQLVSTRIPWGKDYVSTPKEGNFKILVRSLRSNKVQTPGKNKLRPIISLIYKKPIGK